MSRAAVERSATDTGGFDSVVVEALATASELLLRNRLDHCGQEVLRLVGSATHADTATLWRYRTGPQRTSQEPVFRWTATDDVDHVVALASALPLEEVIGEGRECFDRGENLTVRIREWAAARSIDADHWTVRTLYTSPVRVQGVLWGDVSFGYLSEAPHDPAIDDVLRSACLILSAAISRDTERDVRARPADGDTAVAHPQAGDVDTHSGTSAGASTTVLLVEDDEIIREFTRRALVRQGYHVLVASQPDEALAMAYQTKTIAALVTDFAMPGMNGRELALLFREVHPLAAVIVASGHLVNDVLTFGSDGMEFLAKPFGSAELVDTLSRMLNGPRR